MAAAVGSLEEGVRSLLGYQTTERHSSGWHYPASNTSKG